MLVMGISGGLFNTPEDGSIYQPRFSFHDGAAVLLKDGEVLAGIEAERLNRIKHSNKFPLEAIKFCLESSGATIRDLDYFAYYSEEVHLDSTVFGLNMRRTLDNLKFDESPNAKSFLQRLISREFAYEMPLERLIFVNHHEAHALSAFLPSGFDESLILTLDGEGDHESGRVIVGNRSSFEVLARFPAHLSLGIAYANIINILGFQAFDEYKAMGLAPYGNAQRFARLFRSFYALLPDGEYALDYREIHNLFRRVRPRKKGEEFTQDHKDVAAALQEALEQVVFHIITHFQNKTEQRNLCFAGGVAHNCTLNGKLLNAKIFDRVFVQPAAHDAGCAYGAALSVFFNRPEIKIKPLKHLYWGSEIEDHDAVANALAPWRDFISISKQDDICSSAAKLIADGNVIGWVQGRSEFGPRALGNRSILADPRPAENRELINAMVKKREAYRPFAPSVLEEYAEEFFEIDPDDQNLSYMIFVINVRPEKRRLLGAVTHVDGTARIQTVSKAANEKYWLLIDAFREITGIPILLNTSFNNHAEPIVDSVEDALVCFLTTKLDYLIAGDYLVSKKEFSHESFLKLVPALPQFVAICQTKKADACGQPAVFFECRKNTDPTFKIDLSATVFDLLLRADGRASLADLIAGGSDAVRHQHPEDRLRELEDLWSQRVIALKPGAAQDRDHE